MLINKAAIRPKLIGNLKEGVAMASPQSSPAKRALVERLVLWH